MTFYTLLNSLRHTIINYQSMGQLMWTKSVVITAMNVIHYELKKKKDENPLNK